MRTRTEWETEIDGAAITNGLTLSTSSTAEWKLWRDMVITIAIIIEGIVSLFKKEVKDYIAAEQHGGIYWYGQISKEFQYGDSLVVNDGIVEYSPVDISHRIVTKVSVKEVLDDVLVIKVAKTVSGDFVKLSSGEFTAYKSYMHKRKLPGTKLNMYSADADLVYIDTIVYYDPLVDPANLQADIMAALDVFRQNFEFDDVLFRSAIIEVIMNVPGIVGVGAMDINIGALFIEQFVELPSGYFNIDPLSLIDLSIKP